jgi:hypothetical protein
LALSSLFFLGDNTQITMDDDKNSAAYFNGGAAAPPPAPDAAAPTTTMSDDDTITSYVLARSGLTSVGGGKDENSPNSTP